MLSVTTRPSSDGRQRNARFAPATWLVLLGTVAWAAPAKPAEVRAFEMLRNGGMYRLHYDIALSADLDRVRAVLERYDRIPRLDPDIEQVTMLGANANGSVRMRLAASQCLLVFCVRYRWTQDVHTLPSGNILAVVVPGEGDIHAGWVLYRTVREGDNTRLIVDADVDASGIPLPASLAAAWMRDRLRDEALETARLVEQAARESSLSSGSHASAPMPMRKVHTRPAPVNALAM